jgi:plastocyanin
VVAAVAITAMVGTGIALAASDTIVAGPSDAFSQATYNTDPGAVVPFQDNGGTHNVTARQTGPDGQALFRSSTISSGSTSVQGTQYLSPGDYAFFCTVHPTTMSGTLHVTGNGTPQPRPTATLTVRTKTISKAIKKGISVTVNPSPGSTIVELTAKLGKATLGKVTTGPGNTNTAQQTGVIKLTKAGKSKLSKKSKASVTVTGAIQFGSPVTTKAKLK